MVDVDEDIYLQMRIKPTLTVVIKVDGGDNEGYPGGLPREGMALNLPLYFTRDEVSQSRFKEIVVSPPVQGPMLM